MCKKYASVYSIKSAGVVKLIGRLIQGRSDLVGCWRRAPFVYKTRAGKIPVSSDLLVDHSKRRNLDGFSVR